MRGFFFLCQVHTHFSTETAKPTRLPSPEVLFQYLGFLWASNSHVSAELSNILKFSDSGIFSQFSNQDGFWMHSVVVFPHDKNIILAVNWAFQIATHLIIITEVLHIFSPGYLEIKPSHPIYCNMNMLSLLFLRIYPEDVASFSFSAHWSYLWLFWCENNIFHPLPTQNSPSRLSMVPQWQCLWWRNQGGICQLQLVVWGCCYSHTLAIQLWLYPLWPFWIGPQRKTKHLVLFFTLEYWFPNKSSDLGDVPPLNMGILIWEYWLTREESNVGND